MCKWPFCRWARSAGPLLLRLYRARTGPELLLRTHVDVTGHGGRRVVVHLEEIKVYLMKYLRPTLQKRVGGY